MSGLCEQEVAAALAAQQASDQALEEVGDASQALDEAMRAWEVTAYGAAAACGGTILAAAGGSVGGTIGAGLACTAAGAALDAAGDVVDARQQDLDEALDAANDAGEDFGNAIDELKECVEELEGIVIFDE
ncbi:MAG: hypothetical protein AAF754_15795 [Pseudomonadota bacterium]